MKTQYATFFLALVLALGAVAEGQLRHDGTIMVPFEFVVAGNRLPAGTYNISPLSEQGLEGLMLSNFENRSSMFVLPTEFESSSGSKVTLSFEQIGDAHVLSGVETPQGVYLIPISKSAAALAKAKRAEGTMTAGTQ